jgi:hypothetical protein
MTFLRTHYVSVVHRMHLDAPVRAARRAVSRHTLTAQERANLRASLPAPTGIVTASLGGHPRRRGAPRAHRESLAMTLSTPRRGRTRTRRRSAERGNPPTLLSVDLSDRKEHALHSLTIAEFAVRPGVGLGCGALIGLERQWRARMAGLRTNALVAAGATLFVLYSVAAGDPTSPTRVASYVVSGVGFLGGGVIVRDGSNVRGLNTAATLWSSAAVGVLAGAGLLLFSLVGTAAVVATHLFGRPLGRFIDHDQTADPDEELHPHRLYLT